MSGQDKQDRMWSSVRFYLPRLCLMYHPNFHPSQTLSSPTSLTDAPEHSQYHHISIAGSSHSATCRQRRLTTRREVFFSSFLFFSLFVLEKYETTGMQLFFTLFRYYCSIYRFAFFFVCLILARDSPSFSYFARSRTGVRPRFSAHTEQPHSNCK